MIPHVSRLLELWRIAAHYGLDTLFPAEELPRKIPACAIPHPDASGCLVQS